MGCAGLSTRVSVCCAAETVEAVAATLGNRTAVQALVHISAEFAFSATHIQVRVSVPVLSWSPFLP